ncbi:MAG: hypothetical protein PHD51_04335 [Patescibacteria group bacterium]|nr:hypothetical protein [Patescibacteria group bacterium]MDD5490852.1 hypothetical protein [Patescibacteria group bacterium]
MTHKLQNSWVRYRKVANPFSFCKRMKEFAAKEKLEIVSGAALPPFRPPAGGFV